MPEWLSAVQPALLNQSATLFRRRYYNNSSHAGFILYLSDANVNDGNAMRQALKDSKGLGNFRNLFLHSPGGQKDGIKLIPISEVAAKDEFSGIKNVTRDDMLTALRGAAAVARHRRAELRRLRRYRQGRSGLGAYGAGPAAGTHDRDQRLAGL